jgi:hypothetical protein
MRSAYGQADEMHVRMRVPLPIDAKIGYSPLKND